MGTKRDCRTSPKYSCSGPKLLDTLVKELLGGPISQKDTEPPTNVKNIVVTNKNSNSVQLNWTASTDNVGVTEYEITAGENGVQQQIALQLKT